MSGVYHSFVTLLSFLMNAIMSENNINEDLSEICLPIGQQIEKKVDKRLNCIYFVVEECQSDLMAKAFQLCDADPRVYNQSIESKDLYNWYHLRDKLFVINSFVGNSFNYLNKRNARIVGPLVVMSAYSNHSINSLFKTNCFKFNPIINKCMENCFVCIRIRDQEKSNHLIKLITLMSGIYCHRMSSVVTHLVIDSIKIRLQRKALNFGVRVVTEEWVLKCWHHSKDTIFNGNDKSIVEQFLVPLFKKVPINSEILLIEDNIQSEESMEDIDHNMNLNCESIDWIDFECESKCKPIEVLCEEKEPIDRQIFNCIDFIEVKSEDKQETHKMNTNITINKSDGFDDGLNWIFESTVEEKETIEMNVYKSEDIIMREIEDKNEEQRDDGLDWIYFECPKSEVLVNPVVIDQINDKVIIPVKKGSKIKRENNEKNDKKRKKCCQQNSVVWNFKEFSGIPSQRPFFRI